MKRIRNLEPAEIVDQVILVNQLCLEKFGSRITNIVYMGMGEPLLTYANVMRNIEMITSPDGLAMSPRRITVSTAGIAKMIKKLADDDAKNKSGLIICTLLMIQNAMKLCPSMSKTTYKPWWMPFPIFIEKRTTESVMNT